MIVVIRHVLNDMHPTLIFGVILRFVTSVMKSNSTVVVTIC